MVSVLCLTAGGCASPPFDGSLARVTADFETTPVAHGGDAADDAVILADEAGWIRILGTDKKGGLAVYDGQGRQTALPTTGRLNNVDAVWLPDGRFLVAASNRTQRRVDLFLADPVTDHVQQAGRVSLSLSPPYGLCMGQTPDTSIFVGDVRGRVEWWSLDENLAARRVKVIRFDSQTEGCVFDARSGTLHVGEEDRGIWSVDLETGRRRLLDEVGDGFLVADVEGLDIYIDRETGQRFLLASSQGDNTFVVYRLPAGERLLKFAIVGDAQAGIDGVEETDGVAVTGAALPGYPAGLLVVQDGRNRDPRERQNFKAIDWRKIRNLLGE